MAHIIEMPKLSDDMSVGTIGRWHKKEGDVVKAGEALADVETDKATLELEAPFAGILLKRFVGEGAKVPVDSPVCAIGQPGDQVGPADAPSAGPSEEPAPAAGSTTPPTRDIEPSGVAENTPEPAASWPPVFAGIAVTSSQRLRISPLARKLARAKSIDPAPIAGSGPRGRIIRMDILAAESKRRGGESVAPSTVPVLMERPVAGPEAGRMDRVVPNSPMRAAIARRLLESKTTIPHFYLEIEVDAGPLLGLRRQLNGSPAQEGTKLSVNDLILKACAFALRVVPAVNTSWEGHSIRHYAEADVSFAVAIEDGLVTPVIRNAAWKSLQSISAEAQALAGRAREKKLRPDEYTGGTFCVSNLGMLGITRFAAIINPPNAAILAVGGIRRQPVVKGDEIVIGEVMVLTLSCDHRLVDGALGARFLGVVRDYLERPALLLCPPPPSNTP